MTALRVAAPAEGGSTPRKDQPKAQHVFCSSHLSTPSDVTGSGCSPSAHLAELPSLRFAALHGPRLVGIMADWLINHPLDPRGVGITPTEGQGPSRSKASPSVSHPKWQHLDTSPSYNSGPSLPAGPARLSVPGHLPRQLRALAKHGWCRPQSSSRMPSSPMSYFHLYVEATHLAGGPKDGQGLLVTSLPGTPAPSRPWAPRMASSRLWTHTLSAANTATPRPPSLQSWPLLPRHTLDSAPGGSWGRSPDPDMSQSKPRTSPPPGVPISGPCH